MLRKTYDWMLGIAGGRARPMRLGPCPSRRARSFPVPPDVMLVPMALARPERAWFYAGLCTLTSVAGGLVGYAIGALLYDSVGKWLFQLYGLEAGAEAFRTAYAQYGAWIILLKGFTPIPYKLVTITSGFAGYDLLAFTVLSLITRGARFALVAALIGRYGGPIKLLLDRHLVPIAAVLAVFVVGGFVAIKFLY
jgi:membrane protein YqaA with SNARE-associated domain